MKNKIYVLLLLMGLIFFPSTVNADTPSVSLTCEKTSVSNQFECSVDGMSDYFVETAKFKIVLGNGLKLVDSPKYADIWAYSDMNSSSKLITLIGLKTGANVVPEQGYNYVTFVVEVDGVFSSTVTIDSIEVDSGKQSYLPLGSISEPITVTDSGSTGGDDTSGGDDSSTEQVKYTATFMGNGGGSIDPIECIAENGSCTITPTTEPTLAGNKFVGWSTDADCPQNKINSSTLTLYGDTTFYACWEEASSTESNTTVYKVSFSDPNYVDSLDGNVPSCTPETGKTSCTVNISNLPNPTKNGYTFTGWNTNSNCTGSLVQSTLTLSKETTALYPCWEKNDTTGSTGGNVENNPKTSDTLLYVVLAVGLVAFGYAILYFKNSKKEN